MKTNFKKAISILLAVMMLVSVCVITGTTVQADGKTSVYADYTKYRGQDLANTYAKLKNGEEVNILYYGGSVTNGTGASKPEETSWRGLVSKWFVDNFPEATINNINVSFGGTGSYFGAYRLNHDVIPKDPDLIFIEFAINDHYDNQVRALSKDDAAYQFESIVRQLRSQIPDCDIVTVLTTNKGCISTNRAGNLHPQAQGHEEISIAYDIPSLHIGRALSDQIPYNNLDEVWYSYVTDPVHPNDNGYALYFDVIKEYLTNCLIYGNYSGQVTNHTMPRVANAKEYLLDGDIQFIPADYDLLVKSIELGGKNFTYKSEVTHLNNYPGCVSASSNQVGTFVIEFTGTEIALLQKSSVIESFNVVVDGKNYVIANCYKIYPELLVSNLTPGKHTIKVTPVYKSTETDRTFDIMGFFTRDQSKQTKKYYHSHTFSNYISDNNATCKLDGTKTANCDYPGCDKTDTQQLTGSKLTHNFVIEMKKIATLTTYGKGNSKCSLCDRLDRIVEFSPATNISLSATNYTYDGKTKKPSVVVKDADGNAISSNYYTITYPTSSVNVGTYNVKVVFKGAYSGTKTLTYKINPIKSTALNLKLSATSYTYNGKAKTPTVTVKDAAGKILKANTDYTVTYPTGRIKAGTYKVKVVFKGKYSGTEYLTFKVNPVKSTKLTAKLSTTTYTYNGKAKKPTVTVKDAAGKILKANTDYTVTYPTGRIKAGTYKVKVVFKGNYSGTKYLTFKINPIKSSKLIAKLSKTSYTYTGKAISPTVVVKTAGGKTLKKNTDYTVTYQTARKNVGNHKVKITFKGNYSGTKYLYFKILPSKTPVSKVTAGKKSLKVTIKKQPTQATGYQIQYSTSKTFKSAKIKTVNKYSTTSATLKGLSAKKTYYVRVRTYKKVGSKLYYSGWSSYKSQKTK